MTRFKPKSEFSRNVLTLMTGTTIAQAIPITISPILTRIYTPEDFGVFALFLSITAIFGSIANGRYELAIMLPKKDEDAINIFALGFIITSAISLVLLVLVVAFNDYFTKLLNNEEISVWLYFMPIAVLFTGLWNILNYFNNRKKQYKDLAKTTIIKSIVTAIVQLSVGFIKNGAIGLVSGQLLSQLFANTKLLSNIIKDKVLLSKISKVKVIALAKRYKDFPRFLVVAHGVNSLSSQSHILIFSSFFATSVVGYLSFAQRLLGLPIGLIASSIGDVFRQEATVQYNKNKECLDIYKSTFKKLLFISVLPFAVLFFIAPSLFAFIFGDSWRVAGEYAQVMIPMYFFRFTISPLSNMYMIAEKQKLDLYWQIYLLCSVVLAIVLSYYLYKDSYISIMFFSAAYSIAYIINVFFTYNFAKGSK